MKDIRILLADDSELVRYGVRGMLEQEEDMEIVGDCSSAEDVLFLTEIVSPDVILMDAKISGIGAFEVTRRLHQKQTPCSVIILSLNEDYLDEALEAGVAGYLLGDINCQELAQAIRKAYHGQSVIDERPTLLSHDVDKEPEYPLPEDMVRELELVIPPPFEAAQLLRFIDQVEEILGATIVQGIGSWKKGTTITIVPRNGTSLPDLLHRLAKIPEVEDVVEKPVAGHKSFSFSLKSVAEPETGFRKEFQVTLKQADTTE